MALMTNAQRKRANKIRGIVSVVATVGFVATTIGFVGLGGGLLVSMVFVPLIVFAINSDG